jgi:anoctamin-8
MKFDHLCVSLLKAAEELHLPKRVKREFGGGQKEFVLHESHIFEGVEAEASFFSSQERQWLVLSLLQMLRASAGDEVAGLRLIEGQAIGMSAIILPPLMAHFRSRAIA